MSFLDKMRKRVHYQEIDRSAMKVAEELDNTFKNIPEEGVDVSALLPQEISFHSELIRDYTIGVEGKGKLVIEQKNGSTVQTSEYWMTDNGQNITIQYQKGKDVTLHGYVTYLSCEFDDITFIDASKCTQLTTLYCSNNGELSTLDVSNCNKLTYLECQNNNISTLDVSTNTMLMHLLCTNSKLTFIDTKRNPYLKIFDCGGNEITHLNVSTNAELEELDCSGNQLTELDLSNNSKIVKLVCANNKIKELNIYSVLSSSYTDVDAERIVTHESSGIIQGAFGSGSILEELDISSLCKSIYVEEIGINLCIVAIGSENPYAQNPDAINRTIAGMRDVRSEDGMFIFAINYDSSHFSDEQKAALEAKGWITELPF